MPYTRPYTGGFQDFPDTTTPINATALNTIDVGVKTANDQFQTVTTAQRAALTPTVGQAVWDSDLRQLMVYMNAAGGNAWQPVGNRIVCASTTRPSTPFEGQEIYETDSNQTLVYNGSSWIEVGDLDNTNGVPSGLAPFFTTWTSFTPTINQGANLDITKTIAYAAYLKIGQLVFAQMNVNMTGAGATGDFQVSLPSGLAGKSAVHAIGSAVFFDANLVTHTTLQAIMTASTTVRFLSDGSASNYFGASPVVLLAAGDGLQISLMYEAA